jgi:hypothetical protein
VTEIGVLTPEEFYGAEIGGLPPALMGITRILEASAHQFNILDSASDLSGYKVIVLPDKIPVYDDLAQKLRAYLDRGGALIASFESGMNVEASEFARQVLGVRLKSEGPLILTASWSVENAFRPTTMSNISCRDNWARDWSRQNTYYTFAAWMSKPSPGLKRWRTRL